MKKRWGLIILTLVFFASFGLGILFARSQKLPLHAEMDVQADQNMTHYFSAELNNKRFIPADIQKQNTQEFLSYFFMPWNKNLPSSSINSIKKNIKRFLLSSEKKTRWGMNYHQNTPAWLKAIVDNINLDSFPNKDSRGITIDNTELRALPTDSPAYANDQKGGDGFPFDLLQIDSLWMGQPVRILQITRDGAWLFIQTSGVMGWAPSKNIAFVQQDFIKRYETGHYVTITKDNIAIKDNSDLFQSMSRIGSLFPVANNQIIIPMANEKKQAIISHTQLARNTYSEFPLPATYKNMAKLINNLSGEPYGWGGYQNWRDCSLTMQSIFADFGMNIPRSSYEQNSFGVKVNLSSLSTKEKLAYIEKHAIPFSTLIGLDGHVMLYIGSVSGKPYVFHNKWGLHTKNIFGDTGRSIIGKAAITPLALGAHIPFVQKTLAQSVKYMTFLLRT
jgi:hypothetical protein